MKPVLLTGATGLLGRSIVPVLLKAGYPVRAASRRAMARARDEHVHWVVADLASGAGVATAVEGVSAVIHCATSPVRRSRQVDLEGTRVLLEAAQLAEVRHLVYPSIIGIDRVPYPYYRQKLAAEEAIAASGIPYSILRAAKFHVFMDMLLRGVNRLPLMLLPTDFEDQPVDASEVAERLVRQLSQGPGGMLRELAGPEILSYRELAEQWLRAHGLRKRIVHVPIPGRAASGFRRGETTNADAERGTVTWSQWLARERSRHP